MNILDFHKRKINPAPKISMVTCYDYCSASIMNASNVDCILVGDSMSMVMYGYADTLGATVNMITQHVQAVAKASRVHKFIVGDLPFCSHCKA